MYDKEFTKSQARKAFRYLKRGVCPPDRIGFFTVGLNSELQMILGELKSIRTGGSKSASYFLEAPYGYGKSHLLKMVKSIALQQNFGVAQITHDSYERAFNHPQRYVHYLYENLQIPGLSTLGLGEIVSQLLRNSQRNNLLHWSETPNVRWGIGSYIRRMANIGESSDPSNLKYYINSCDIQFRSGSYNNYLLFERLQILTDFCRAIGLSGLVVLFDEVESIATLLPNILSRLKSYEILNKLTKPREFPYCCFFFAISPDFGRKVEIWDHRFEYESHKNYYPDGCRFMETWVNDGLNLIHIPKVDKASNRELCFKLKNLHELAYSWSSINTISTNFIDSFLNECEIKSLPEREIVRSFVNILDTCQQHTSCNPGNELSLATPPSLIERLRNRGLEVIDKRSSGGALWVVGGLEIIQLLQQSGGEGVSFRFANGGGQATGERAAWWTHSPA